MPSNLSLKPCRTRPCAGKTDEFRARLRQLIGNIEGLNEEEVFKAEQPALDDILPEAFAAVREASKRTIGLRHYDIQMIGGMALHRRQDRRNAHR